MFKGIWTNDLSWSNILLLKKQGFDSLFLKCGFFYEKFTNDTMDVTERQKLTAEAMKNAYDFAVGIGYKFFIVDIGWGLGELDNNYFWQKIYKKFMFTTGVVFYHGEPLEGLVESEQYTYEQVMNVMLEKSSTVGYKKFVMDSTKRNLFRVENYNFWFNGKVVPSYYYNAQENWHSMLPFVWIFGQLSIGSSLRYKFLIEEAKKNWVSAVFLYQGNYPAWNIEGWLLKILQIFGLLERYENWMRNRFIKAAEEKVIGESGKISLAAI